MQPRLLGNLLRYATLLLSMCGGLGGCDAAGCAIDTDCMLGQYCSAAQVCVDRGAGTDTGPRDSGSPIDTGPRPDAPAGDAPVGDAPRSDTPSATDAPSSMCPDVAGTYTVTMVGMMCTGFMGTTLVLTGPPARECSFEVAVGMTMAGFVTQTSGNDFSGSLAGIPGGPACTLSFGTDLTMATIRCGGCTIAATVRP